MYPIFFTLPFFPGLKLHTYGVLVALGFFVGIVWIHYEAKRLGEPVEKITDLCFYIIIASIVGSRLYYVVFEQPDFFSHPLDFFKIWEGGLSFYGGFLGANAIGFWYLHRHRLGFWKVSDIFVTGLAIGHAIGRLGCFAAGCCYGRPVPEGFHWGVIFPNNPESLAPPDIFLYPTQLMEFAAEIFIFFVLVMFRKKKKFDGQVMLLYLILYPVFRVFAEPFRGDQARDLVLQGSLSVSQIVSILLAVSAVLVWVFRSRKMVRR